MLKRIHTYFASEDPLTRIVKMNVLYSFLIKIVSVVLNLVLVPLTLGLLNKDLYGVWLTLSSIVTWFTFIDFGLGNGLRNKLTELLSQGKQDQAQIYVSTLYATTLGIGLVFWILYSCIHPWLNWAQILRVPQQWSGQIGMLAYVAFSAFWMQLVLRNISFILLAVQKSALNALFPLLSNFLTLILLILLRTYLSGSILYVGLTLLIPQLLVLGALQYYCFRYELAYLRPILKQSQWSVLRNFGSMSLSFFIIQIAGVVIFMMVNLLITRFLGPAYVTVYDIAYKYFGMLPMLFGLALTPLWSAFGHAYHTNNLSWIQKTLKQMRQIWLLITLGQVLLVLAAQYLIPLWVGRSITIPIELSLTMVLYYSLYTYGGIYINLLNGVGKVYFQMLASITGAILMIPLAYTFVILANFGLIGIQLSVIICTINASLIAPIEVKKLLLKMKTYKQSVEVI
ncbi:MAG: MATE family efflux transporter [Chitinophagaceae bacterium]|nr:MAG: MATE family efflux transporter [Chitinophagaceae bacterium]